MKHNTALLTSLYVSHLSCHSLLGHELLHRDYRQSLPNMLKRKKVSERMLLLVSLALVEKVHRLVRGQHECAASGEGKDEY